MQLDVNFLEVYAPSARRSRALLVFAAVLSLALVVNIWLQHKARADREREALLKYERQAQSAARASEQRSTLEFEQRASAIAAYRSTLPWAEVLNAIEQVAELNLDSADFRVDEGLVVLEATASTADQLSIAIARLAERLPDWDVRTVRQAVASGRATASLELRDRLAPSDVRESRASGNR